jgi:hypothetical protein
MTPASILLTLERGRSGGRGTSKIEEMGDTDRRGATAGAVSCTTGGE